jgi:hypothetical protein
MSVKINRDTKKVTISGMTQSSLAGFGMDKRNPCWSRPGKKLQGKSNGETVI